MATIIYVHAHMYMIKYAHGFVMCSLTESIDHAVPVHSGMTRTGKSAFELTLGHNRNMYFAALTAGTQRTHTADTVNVT